MEPTLYEIRPVPGFAGCLADTNGDVLSDKRKVRIIRKGTENKTGYLMISFRIKQKTAMRSVHRLVAAAFLGPPPDGYQVNHIDGNKLNNSPTNLEYVTPSANIKHAFQTGLNKARRGVRNTNSKLKTGQVEELKKLWESGQFSQRELGIVFGLTQSAVSRAVTGRSYRE